MCVQLLTELITCSYVWFVNWKQCVIWLRVLAIDNPWDGLLLSKRQRRLLYQPRPTLWGQCSFFMPTKPCLESMKCLFDWVEIGWIRRQINEFSAFLPMSLWMHCLKYTKQNSPHSSSMICQTSSSWWIMQLSMTTTLRGPGYGVSLGAYIRAGVSPKQKRDSDSQVVHERIR
jgi:hypothetical protein